MIINTINFVICILCPYAIEEYAYKKIISNKNGNTPQADAPAQTYGWRVIWDAAYHIGIISSAYQLIFTSSPLTFWEWLGYFFFLCGISLRMFSLRELGQFYDAAILIKPEHQIIQSGPYRVLRHPLHFGTLLKIIGLAAFSPLWLAAPVVFASLAVNLYLNYTEDRIHAQILGASFAPYYLRTWDLVDLIFWKNKKGGA